MATLTTNYSFTKPAKSDLGWWATLNADLDAIDTTIKAIQTQIDGFFPGGALHVSGLNMTNSQGAWICWNRAGTGEVDLISHQGAGTGGFGFYTTANGSTFGHLADLMYTTVESETTLKIGRVGSSVYSVARVYQGPVNSGGGGFRLLVVPN